MINLKTTTLYSLVYNERQDMLEQTVRVMNYMRSLCDFAEVTLFTCIAPHRKLNGRLVQVPRLDADGANRFLIKLLPEVIHTDRCMCVHPDGFILDPDRWRPHWVEYDYIGAPWKDGVVGNAGFSMESKRCLQAKASLPFAWGWNSDEWFCRHKRFDMERHGVNFAPWDEALAFATETVHHDRPSFGFHGNSVDKRKYNEAWARLTQWEMHNPQ